MRDYRSGGRALGAGAAWSVWLLLQACSSGGGDGGSGSGSGVSGFPQATPPPNLAAEIPLTRLACTPFGAPPRPLQPVQNALFVPNCQPGGSRLPDWADPEGTQRYACLYEPPQASVNKPLPLVIWLHPSVATVDGSLAVTNLLDALPGADLSGDATRPGFIMLAPEGRVTERFYASPDDGGSPGWDNWYRQLAPGLAARSVNGRSYGQNVDAATIDHYLAQALASGKVDPHRVYLMGWSNGSALAILYALNRPGIAATAVYSSPNPVYSDRDPCSQAPVSTAPVDDTQLQLFNPQAPIYHVHNACDIGGLCPNGEALNAQLASGANNTVRDQLLTTLQQPATQCDASCGTDPLGASSILGDPLGSVLNASGAATGFANHLRWPAGWRDTMFAYLREHTTP